MTWCEKQQTKITAIVGQFCEKLPVVWLNGGPCSAQCKKPHLHLLRTHKAVYLQNRSDDRYLSLFTKGLTQFTMTVIASFYF